MGRRRTRWLTYNSVLNMINKFANIRICPCIISEPNRLSWLIDRLMFYAISAFYKSFNGGTFMNIKVYLHFGNWCIICIFKTYKRVCSTTWQLMFLWIFSDIWIIKWKQLKITISLWIITNDLCVIHIIYIYLCKSIFSYYFYFYHNGIHTLFVEIESIIARNVVILLLIYVNICRLKSEIFRFGYTH